MRWLLLILALVQLQAPTNLRIDGNKMAVTYFGRCNSDGTLISGDPTDWQGLTGYWVKSENAAFTCPGTGSQNIVSLSVYARKASGAGGNMRCAIYDTSNNLISQHTAEFIVDGVAGWYGTAQAVSSVGPLTGGTNYKLIVSCDNSISEWSNYSGGTNGDFSWGANDYTGGFPATRAAGSNTSAIYLIRCGVEPAAAGGLSIPLVMQSYRRRRL